MRSARVVSRVISTMSGRGDAERRGEVQAVARAHSANNNTHIKSRRRAAMVERAARTCTLAPGDWSAGEMRPEAKAPRHNRHLVNRGNTTLCYLFYLGMRL